MITIGQVPTVSAAKVSKQNRRFIFLLSLCCCSEPLLRSFHYLHPGSFSLHAVLSIYQTRELLFSVGSRSSYFRQRGDCWRSEDAARFRLRAHPAKQTCRLTHQSSCSIPGIALERNKSPNRLHNTVPIFTTNFRLFFVNTLSRARCSISFEFWNSRVSRRIGEI